MKKSRLGHSKAKTADIATIKISKMLKDKVRKSKTYRKKMTKKLRKNLFQLSYHRQ